jgi:hypothetical protein
MQKELKKSVRGPRWKLVSQRGNAYVVSRKARQPRASPVDREP